ncbi:acyl-CoA dehydrogenase family protein [Roseomonas sp. GC11]|uniref:acyl-CoA dehydrogenase family protein n=1 Tax=Roseomonas sp. GC11 TaxID=2950546 RepID=UPI0021091329|nr:acyl-CoA dehydrogenase family protein [Roseomonas sp. GC11]
MDVFFSEPLVALRDTVRRFAEREILPRAAAIDREDRFPRDLYKAMAELGLFAVALPEAAGGAGLGALGACVAMEEIARCSAAVGNAFAIPVEAALFLSEHGNARQRALIPGILAGDIIPATAVTEPDHGSDVAGLRTTARREGEGWVLNGTKAWVTLGGVVDALMVFARTGAEGQGHRAMSCFLLDGASPGLIRGKTEDLLGMHGLEDCQITLDGVRAPLDALVGPENGAFKMAMGNFNFSRLMMSAMALGIAQAGFEDAVAYARSRKQFGGPILNFQAVQFMVADMSTEIAASRLLVHHAARLCDAGLPIAKEAAQAKLFTTDMATRNVSNALQIHGGNGYSREYRVERLFRDVRLAQIYEGTNQIQRLIIARQVEKEMA